MLTIGYFWHDGCKRSSPMDLCAHKMDTPCGCGVPCPVGEAGRCAIVPGAEGERILRTGLVVVRWVVTPASVLTRGTLSEVSQMQLRKVRISKLCEDGPFVGLMAKETLPVDTIQRERS